MRIQRDCTLKSTSNNDKRLQYVLGHKGKLHINNGQPMVFVVSDAEAQFDALPPLTEWDSRSLQQKMVGGFSSQSR